jgi:hypothetical protein
MKSEVYKLKMDTPDQLLASNLDAASCIKRREDLLRRTTRDLRTRFAKCTEVDGGIFELQCELQQICRLEIIFELD